MRTAIFTVGVIYGVLLLSAVAMADASQLYGKVYTVDNEVLEGFIRWDKNEASWIDILNGNKELDRKKHKSYRERRREKEDTRVKIFGLTVFESGGDFNLDWGNVAESGIRMGHIKTLTPIGDDAVLLVLKSGDEAELGGGSGDIGEDNREILIEDQKEGIVELYWDDIDHIEFEASPSKESGFGNRLYGTLITARGDEFTGHICWDMDEVFDADVLDGREEHRKRKVEFESIARIERSSSSAAEVTMKNGKTIRLDDSNDIDSGNRGVVVSDMKLGNVTVDWDEFEAIEFKEAPPGPAYDAFDGGKKLKGTIYTEDGLKYTGEIKWDDDEEYTWEILDGDSRDAKFDIEFGNIKSIEKQTNRSSLVTLKDGRSFKLRGSNDVDSDNKGIVVNTGKDEIEIDWEDFGKVEFSE